MKSITACPHCSTQFLVDDEQLSQYNGKVRCGSCLNVFNAVDYIVPSSEVPEIQSAPTITQQSEPESTESVTKEAEKPASVNEEINAEQISTNEEMEQAYIDKTQSLIENIDMHNIAGEVEDAEAKISAELDDLPEVPEISLPDMTDDIEAVEGLEETVAIDDEIEKQSIEREDNNHALDHLANKKTEQDTDEFSYSPNLPSRDELSDANQEDLSTEYSIYDLPNEPSFSIDDSIIASKSSTNDNLLQNTAAPIDAEEVVADDAAEPFFVKEKQPVSPFLILLTAIFMVVLIGQLVYFLRNTIAQQLPDTKPYLEMLCQPLGCTIDLPKNIQLFSIDDSSIQEDITHADVIRLTSTITNRAAFNQAYPNLEVTLTDAQDQPKIRRLFKPIEYLPKELTIKDGISPEDSISIDMPLMTENIKVSGFRILLTY